MALRKEKVEKFKKELLQVRDNLARDLVRANEELLNDENSFADSVDQAAHETDKTFQIHLKNRERTIMHRIETALRRIEDGSFGNCESCGELISEARLKANPAATLCLDCMSEAENKQQRYNRAF